ncbi:hypothetical protein GII30_22815 [Gordonia amarae]|uniref:Uncharacterized protein n=2 Tax=Gordonia amarae TaxID=36821 RepID=G7GTE7_9ACTN|nr:DUF6636 domain-containing protein [Gordonia amarae]MCS3876619.1 hypothetical protein [Gordonia amarae]QHN19509.1 hypothetical protein GII35_23280 [Gordonia amarae]QHN23985.1 hypothetical protein GII34_22780 [Gordonia amarae]QHN32894.1 hypothetical protein GII32_23110 [Gordonia amarae]QHN41613.1 hypothetical protein GII30_22815 [Gordonia amarae]
MNNRTIRAALLGVVVVPVVAALVTGCSSDDEPSTSAMSTVTVTRSADAAAPSNTSSDGGSLSGPNTDAPGTGDDAAPVVTTDAPGSSDEGFTAADPARYRADSTGGDVAFVSPTLNIWCRLGQARYTAGCQAKYAPIPAGADCKGTADYPLSTLSKGFFLEGDKVTPSCFNQGIFTSSERHVLPYGYSISAHGYTCYSRSTGVTCKTPSGRGFVLSMQEARTF